jgi:hypothetical protein
MAQRKADDMKLNGGMRVVAAVLGTLVCTGGLLWARSWTDALGAVKADIATLQVVDAGVVPVLKDILRRLDVNQEEHRQILAKLEELKR